jgi:hypothetical protein
MFTCIHTLSSFFHPLVSMQSTNNLMFLQANSQNVLVFKSLD